MIPSLVLCVSLGFAFEFLFYCITIRLRNVSWLTYVIRSAIVSFFSGTVIPFKILPFGMEKWMDYQPFGSMGGAFLSLYVGSARPLEILGTKFHIKEIAFDRWCATQMVQDLEGMGFTVVPFGQGYKDMSPPTKELMKLTLEQRIAHGGHKVLRWMMDNVYVRQDPAGNIKMDKEKSTEKIDAAVATVMALDRAIRNKGSEGSIYDDRGILVF